MTSALEQLRAWLEERFGHGLALATSQRRKLAIGLPLDSAGQVVQRLAVPHAKQFHRVLELAVLYASARNAECAQKYRSLQRPRLK